MISKYSIAVLPFVNMSSDPENEYFSDGMTEEILNALSKISGLHVTARTSSFAFKRQALDVREIAQRLHVALILEGSVRKSGNRMRITTQLIQAVDGFHLWSESWDRELQDIFLIQDDIAARIAGKIRADLHREIPVNEAGHVNPEAFDWYLQGMAVVNTRNLGQVKHAVTCFERALELEPSFVKALIGLSDCYTWLSATGLMNAREAQQNVAACIERVFALDPNQPEVYQILSGQSFWMERDIPAALHHVRTALRLQPSFADALMNQGMLLAAAGCVEEAFDSLFQAERLNPLSPTSNYSIGFIYSLTGESEQALEYLNKNILVNPHWDAAYWTKNEVLCRLGRFDEAWTLIQMVAADADSTLPLAALKGYYFASQGKRAEAYEQIDVLKQRGAQTIENSPGPATLASIYLLLGEHERALEFLGYGLAHGAAPLLFIKIDSLWDELREHPRYVNALKHMIFPEEEPPDEAPPKKYKKSSLSPQYAKRMEHRLRTFMAAEKPYLNTQITLSDLAEAINVSTTLLSQLLNEHIGQNFYDYVNAYRLEHFLAMSKDPQYHHFTLLSLAYEAGFNSKTTFNVFFKKSYGMTPSEYLKREDLHVRQF